ncbi:protein of unknown function [Hyphomicrobium sp. 1Nfss2.1]
MRRRVRLFLLKTKPYVSGGLLPQWLRPALSGVLSIGRVERRGVIG